MPLPRSVSWIKITATMATCLRCTVEWSGFVSSSPSMHSNKEMGQHSRRLLLFVTQDSLSGCSHYSCPRCPGSIAIIEYPLASPPLRGTIPHITILRWLVHHQMSLARCSFLPATILLLPPTLMERSASTTPVAVRGRSCFEERLTRSRRRWLCWPEAFV